jgi:hypothetical protein
MMHNREMVVRLQNAHADYIEDLYRQSMSLPGNPDGIEILRIGDTRIFLSNRNRLENRAIFTGNETMDELREVTAYFDRKGVTGYFEINPANFYRSDPFSWDSVMLPALISLGYHPGEFRCVWYLDAFPEWNKKEGDMLIRRFTSHDVDEYIQAKLAVEPVKKESLDHEIRLIRRTFTQSWTNYIGYQGERPVSISRLFMKDEIGYLAWGYTISEFRRQGHHRMHILARLKNAFEAGYDTVFSVTDFNVPSSLSLQKVGFKLAYNYLLMEKPASDG